MSGIFKVACVQNCAGDDMMLTLERSVSLVRRAYNEGADMITVPEFFSCLHVRDRELLTGALPEDHHPALPMFSNLAQETGSWILLGSLGIDDGGDRLKNRSFMIDPSGTIKARYDKIHMFDVELGNGESYKESNFFEPGEKAVVVPTPWGIIGLTICYDLRFAYLYRTLAQAGAKVLTVPAAFMHTTGKAHWHSLLRARAIETGCYVIAPCQNGKHGSARTYGHSLIVDPWGEVLGDGHADDEDVIVAIIDMNKVDEARSKVPALQHDRYYIDPEIF